MSEWESPLERLNYFNGQRLVASDFQTEQDYHMRVRRWLNKSLYTSGIADGLDVTAKEGDAHTVVIHPGLALDPDGREIILVEEQEVPVTGLPSAPGAVVLGNYLVVEYAEEKVSDLEESCVARSRNGAPSRTLSWGGPARIRLSPEIRVQNTWPAPDSGQIVLAQLELDENCAVRDIHTYVRKYVGTAKPAKVRALALEGEKDIDKDNPKRIYFHVQGGAPDTVTLYLRAAQFSTLFYTELGQHTHEITIEVDAEENDEYLHTHDVILPDLTTELDGLSKHDHVVKADVGNTQKSLFEIQDSGDHEGHVSLNNLVDLEVSEGEHQHTIQGRTLTTEAEGSIQSYTATGTIEATGQSTAVRTGTKPRTYVEDLRVFIDGTDPGDEYTTQILDRLGWAKLGNGTATHKLVTEGTGAIQLDLLGIDFFEGEHVIELRVDSGGGRILYNLYME